MQFHNKLQYKSKTAIPKGCFISNAYQICTSKICIVILILIAPVMMTQTSCKKLVEVTPPVTALTGENVYTNDATAAAVLTGIYTNMSVGAGFVTGANSISMECGLSADEFTLYGGSSAQANLILFYKNALTNQQYLTFWEPCYGVLLQINSAIEGLNTATSLTPTVRQQLLGEAEFLRGFIYFYLVNLYGDVPLVLSSNYQTNTIIARTPKAQVYQQIITDLKDAQRLLSPNYLDATIKSMTTERVRPTSWAATALLARTYLYTDSLSNAKAQATAVINNSALYSLDTLNGVFLKNSTEAIWQLQPVIATENTQDGLTFVLQAGGPNAYNNPVYLSTFLLNSFEPGDERYRNWVGVDSSTGTKYFYPFKYKSATIGAPVSEYLMVLRLAEQYLIRAESEANLGDYTDAINDLNIIRSRAGLPNYDATVQGPLLTAIIHERQVELFTEWGHRWLDLKRTGTANRVMGTPGNGVCVAKGGTWNTAWQLYPIPLYDLQQDANLKQNAGY